MGPQVSEFDDDTFDRIEATLAGTPQGRFFLAGFARRSRPGDTQAMLDAIARLEAQLAARVPSEEAEKLRGDLAEMTTAIRSAKDGIAEIATGLGRVDGASETLDVIVKTTERATSTILDAAERIQETAWTMREAGADPELCDALDARATDIYSACVFQDLTAQQTAHVVKSLAFLEQRLRDIGSVWAIDAPPSARPALEERKLYLTQSDIDFVIFDEEARIDPRGEDPGPEPDVAGRPAGPGGPEDGTPKDEFTVQDWASRDEFGSFDVEVEPVQDPDVDTVLAEPPAIDSMTPREKLRLFS